MSELQDAKHLVTSFQAAIAGAAAGAETATVCARHLAAGHIYHGVHPFNTLEGPQAVADTVWSPLRVAMPVRQHRPDILFAGRHHMQDDGALWVVSMGHVLGDFIAPWLGIPATNKTTFVPHCAFYRIDDGKIAETVEFFDILSVITQAGVNRRSNDQTAAEFMAPGPLTHDGVMHTERDTAQSRDTFALADTMLNELAQEMTSPADHMARYWHPDMNWFGPTGIGACLGFAGYRRGHTGPFEDRLEFVDYIPESAATAEGNFAAYLWRPGLRMRNLGGYMGMPASDVPAEMRIIDVYRRAGDKLAENWIFIDMLHFAKMQGIDILAELEGQT